VFCFFRTGFSLYPSLAYELFVALVAAVGMLLMPPPYDAYGEDGGCAAAVDEKPDPMVPLVIGYGEGRGDIGPPPPKGDGGRREA